MRSDRHETRRAVGGPGQCVVGDARRDPSEARARASGHGARGAVLSPERNGPPVNHSRTTPPGGKAIGGDARDLRPSPRHEPSAHAAHEIVAWLRASVVDDADESLSGPPPPRSCRRIPAPRSHADEPDATISTLAPSTRRARRPGSCCAPARPAAPVSDNTRGSKVMTRSRGRPPSRSDLRRTSCARTEAVPRPAAPRAG